MGRVDVENESMRGTWIDGYLPDIGEMRRLARLYRGLDTDERGLPGDYGFSQATEGWSSEDFFGSIASAVRDKFEHEKLSPDVRPTPCLMWLVHIDRPPSDPKMRPIYEEFLADPRRDDYYHLITIHKECPVEEGCLQQVMQDLHFSQKTETGYGDRERFTAAVRETLDRYVGIMASTWLEVERLLEAVSDKVAVI